MEKEFDSAKRIAPVRASIGLRQAQTSDGPTTDGYQRKAARDRRGEWRTSENNNALNRLNPVRFGQLAQLPASPSSRWAPLGRGSDGRFGRRRFRAKQDHKAFDTHRSLTRTLPPSAGVLSAFPFRLFCSAAAQVKKQNSR